MKIVVLAGGLSPERDVSLSSGSLIANALMESGHDVLLVDLFLGVENGEKFCSKGEKRYHCAVPEQEPDLAALVAQTGNGGALIGKNVLETCRKADLVFLALHGGIGENGKLQGVLDSFGIKYTGTDYQGSLLAMNKNLAKGIMRFNQIPTPPWMFIDTGRYSIDEILKTIGLPCVVKPCGCGSSAGVSIAESGKELASALNYAGKYEQHGIVEKWIRGREFAVGILDGAALPAIEIIPIQGFYDYKNKYQPGLAKEVCPALLDETVAEKMGRLALQVHNVLGLGSYSRIDFIMDENYTIYCLEANTLPGMTPTSLLPQEAAAVGLSYNELCEKIVGLAL